MTPTISPTSLEQFVIFSSILAGFAFAVVIQLVALKDERGIVSFAEGVFILSSITFIIFTFIGSSILAELGRTSTLQQDFAQDIYFLSNINFVLLFIGLITFLTGIAVVGWIQSKVVGIFATIVAALALVAIFCSIIQLRWIYMVGQ